MREINSLHSRSYLALEIAKQILDSNSSLVILEGSVGSGKTQLLSAVYENIKSFTETNGQRIIVQETAEYSSSPLQLVEAIFQVLDKYKKTEGPVSKAMAWFTRIRRGVNIQSGQNTRSLVAAGFLSLVDPATGTVMAGKAVVDVVKRADESTSKEPTRKSNDFDNDLDWYFLKISQLANALSGINFHIVVEHAENLDIRAYDSIIRFCKKRYKNISLLLVCSSNVKWLSDNSGFIRLKSTLPRNNVHELAALTPEELQQWKRLETGLSLSNEVCADAIRKTGGLPKYLDPWVRSQKTDRMDDLEMKDLPVKDYERVLPGLSQDEKLIMRYLASIELGASVGPDVVAKILATDLPNAITLLAHLCDNELVSQGSGRYSIKEKELLDHLVETTGAVQLNEYRNALLKAVDYRPGVDLSEMHSMDVGLVAGVINESSKAEGHSELLRIATHYLESGQYLSSRDVLDKLERIIDSCGGENTFVRQNISIGRGEIYNQIGRYHETIRELNGDRLSGCKTLKRYLALGEAYLRLNNYVQARRMYAHAAAQAMNEKKYDQLVLAQVRRVNILVDQDDFSVAEKIIAQYDRGKFGEQISLATRCHVYRWKARVHVARGDSHGRTLAMDAAQAAVNLSRSLSRRHKANCEFVAGYVYLHNDRLGDARLALKSSLDTAIELGNKDLEVYNLIVLTLVSIVEKDRDSARQWHGRLSAAIDYSAPLEERYLQLLGELLNCFDGGVNTGRCRNLAVQFESFGKKCAANVCRVLSVPGHQEARKLLLENRIYL